MKKLSHYTIKIILLLICFLVTETTLLAKVPNGNTNQYAALIYAWNDAHNNWRFKDLDELYAPKLLYYCNKLSREECISNKTTQVSPKTVFIQNIVSPIKCLDFGKGLVKCEFIKEVIFNDKTNRYPAYLILRQTGKYLRIVCESDDITDSNLGFRISPSLLETKFGEQKPKSIKPERESNNSAIYYLLVLLTIATIWYVLFLRQKVNKQSTTASSLNPTEVKPDIPLTEPNKEIKVTVNVVMDKNGGIQKTTTDEEHNTEKGHEFEKYIVSKFNPTYFTVLEWTSDKKSGNLYPLSNMNPDLVIKYSHAVLESVFAIECKYKSFISGDKLELAKMEQMDRYRHFGKEKQMAVYIVLGVGGEPNNPVEMYLIPIKEIKYNYIAVKDLSKYRKTLTSNFYFNMSSIALT